MGALVSAMASRELDACQGLGCSSSSFNIFACHSILRKEKNLLSDNVSILAQIKVVVQVCWILDPKAFLLHDIHSVKFLVSSLHATFRPTAASVLTVTSTTVGLQSTRRPD